MPVCPDEWLWNQGERGPESDILPSFRVTFGGKKTNLTTIAIVVLLFSLSPSSLLSLSSLQGGVTRIISGLSSGWEFLNS